MRGVNMLKLIIFMAIAIHIYNVPDVVGFYMVVGFFWGIAWLIGKMLGGAICSVARSCKG